MVISAVRFTDYKSARSSPSSKLLGYYHPSALRTNKSTYWAKLQTPKSEPNSNFPLLLFLHAAGQSADEMFDYLGTAPEEAGVAVLAPNSRDNTWDAIGGSFGPDVKFLNRALELGFEMLGKCWRLMPDG